MVDLSESIAGKRKRANGKDDGSKRFRNQKKDIKNKRFTVGHLK